MVSKIGTGTIPAGGDAADRLRLRVDEIYRAESRRVFATLVRRLGDCNLAEEALHDAFRAKCPNPSVLAASL